MFRLCTVQWQQGDVFLESSVLTEMDSSKRFKSDSNGLCFIRFRRARSGRYMYEYSWSKWSCALCNNNNKVLLRAKHFNQKKRNPVLAWKNCSHSFILFNKKVWHPFLSLKSNNVQLFWVEMMWWSSKFEVFLVVVLIVVAAVVTVMSLKACIFFTNSNFQYSLF